MNYSSFVTDLADLMRRKRNAAANPKSLFEGADPGNVGNVFDSIKPSDIIAYDESAYGTPIRVLEIVGADVNGEMICVSVQQERILDNALELSNAGVFTDTVEGPLVGLVEFGAGAGIGRFEFDIPSAIFTPGAVSYYDASAGEQYTDGLFPSGRVNGALLSLPASSLRVYVRNDANAPFIIQGMPGDPQPVVPLNTLKASAKVRVHATYGRRPYPHVLTRTVPIVGRSTRQFAASDDFSIMIPSYSRKLFIPRSSGGGGNVTLNVQFYQSATGSLRGPYTIGVGSDGPLDIMPLDTAVRVMNIGPDSAATLSMVFELGI